MAIKIEDFSVNFSSPTVCMIAHAEKRYKNLAKRKMCEHAVFSFPSPLTLVPIALKGENARSKCTEEKKSMKKSDVEKIA